MRDDDYVPSPNLVEGRVEFIGRVLRTARRGSPRQRRLALLVILTPLLVFLIVVVLAAVSQAF